MRKKAGSWQFAVYSLQPLDRNLPLRIFIAYCLLPIAYCLLPIAYCLLPIAYCLLHFPIIRPEWYNRQSFFAE